MASSHVWAHGMMVSILLVLPVRWWAFLVRVSSRPPPIRFSKPAKVGIAVEGAGVRSGDEPGVVGVVAGNGVDAQAAAGGAGPPAGAGEGVGRGAADQVGDARERERQIGNLPHALAGEVPGVGLV